MDRGIFLARQGDEQRLKARVEALEQQVADADAARREMSQKPEKILALLDPDLSAQEKKAILQTYVQRIVVYPGNPEPEIVA